MERERTPQRQKKIEKVLRQKQLGLTVVLENVHDPHNIMAVVRSCDAVGIYQIHIIDSITGTKGAWDPRMGKNSSAGSKKWLKFNKYANVDDCFAQLRKEGKKIYTTHMGQETKSLYEIDLTENVALVFGNEHAGVSEEALSKADGNFLIPQMGMIQSLNISVACAVSLFEALRQRQNAGLYNQADFEPDELKQLKLEWLKK